MGRLRLSLQRTRLTLDPPLSNAGCAWTQRSVAIVTVQGVEGAARGTGEVAPLPGYSPDGLEDCERALAALDGLELTATNPVALSDAALAALPAGLPAARFGLELALLDRHARAAGRPLWAVLAELAGSAAQPGGEVALCALVSSAGPAAALAEAERCVLAGARALKLKIGPERLNEPQHAALAALRERFGSSVGLRLDANASLRREELPRALELAARFQVEFVEEPLAQPDPAELACAPCAIALDESLQGLGTAARAQLIERCRAKVVVLKPTALGGLGECVRLARAARALGCDVVVSHALEGPIGWAACAHLALALGSPRAAGLWPLAHQSAGSPRISGGRLLAPAEPGLGAALA